MEENKQIETFWTDLEEQTKRMCWGAVRTERKHIDGMRVGYAHLHTGKDTPSSTYQGETISPDMAVWIDDVQQEALLAAVERWNDLADKVEPHTFRSAACQLTDEEWQLQRRMASTTARAIERCQYGMMDLVKRHRVPLDLIDVPRSERRHRQIPTSEDGRVQLPETFRAPAPSGILASSVDADMIHIDEGIRKSAPKKIADTWAAIYDNRNRARMAKRTEERRKAELVEWVDSYVPGLRATNIRKELDRADEKAGHMVAKRFRVKVLRPNANGNKEQSAFMYPTAKSKVDGEMVNGRAVWMMPMVDPREAARAMEEARDSYYSLRNEARVERSRKLHADTVAINMRDLVTGAITVAGPGESPVAAWVPEHLRCPALAVIAG